MADAVTHPASAKEPSIRTYDVLRSLGFVPDSEAMSDEPGALKANFGSFTLSAIHCWNPRLAEVVLLSAVVVSTCEIGEIECEMPQLLESRELGIAWVTYCLDKHFDGEFRPAKPLPWLEVGRAFQFLLPWERQRAERARERARRDACPRCTVERKWARPAFRALMDQLTAEPVESPVQFWFDGEVLSIRCGGRLFVMPAEGQRWQSAASLSVGALQQLPRRFKRESVLIEVFDRALFIDGSKYLGAQETTIQLDDPRNTEAERE